MTDLGRTYVLDALSTGTTATEVNAQVYVLMVTGNILATPFEAQNVCLMCFRALTEIVVSKPIYGAEKATIVTPMRSSEHADPAEECAVRRLPVIPLPL